MSTEKKGLGLVPKLIIGIIAGILIGMFLPEVLVRILVTVSSILSVPEICNSIHYFKLRCMRYRRFNTGCRQTAGYHHSHCLRFHYSGKYYCLHRCHHSVP